MKALDTYNPITIAVYFFATAGIAMFCMQPILLCLALMGAMTLCILRRDVRSARVHVGFWALFALATLLNPLLSHNGASVLIVIGNAPITAEAIFWGAVSGAAILSVLYLFCSFGAIMQSDKLLYLFGKLSPRLSLILSMALRYVSLFSEQWRKIKQTQIALGLYRDDNVLDRVRGELRIFSILLSWALENGIVTANSMSARGYGTGRRTHFSIFSFTWRDALLLAATLLLAAGTIIPLALGAVTFTFYPTLHLHHAGALSYLCYLSYGALVVLPILLETEDAVKWKYLRSKI